MPIVRAFKLHRFWQTDNPERALRSGLQRMQRMKTIEQQHEILGAAYLLSGLVLDAETGMAIDLITRVTGWSIAEITQLQQKHHP
jgi:hypothetical protein